MKRDEAVDGRAVRTTREQQALAELGTTRFSRGVRSLLVIGFLLTLVSVPAYETVSDVYTNLAARKQIRERGAAGDTLPGRRPQSFAIVDLLPSWGQLVAVRSVREAIHLLPQPERIRQYEDDLVLKSRVGRKVRPGIQWFLTRWLGTGSEKVILGKDQWLFYSDGVRYVTGPGFLEAEQLERRSADQRTQPDPRKAIAQFHAELAGLGISLVLMPIPDKAMIRPNSFGPMAGISAGDLQNPSWPAFVSELK